MAKIVLGIGTSHSPQVSIPASHWPVLMKKDQDDPRLDYQALLSRAKPDIAQEITPEKMEERDRIAQKSVAVLGEALKQSGVDAVVILGDDQHEQFHEENMPVFAVYHGKTLPVVKRHGRAPAGWKIEEEKHWADTQNEYPTAVDLADHLIRALITEEFDVARSNRFKEEIGVGHAFSFLYRRLLPGDSIPMVPLMVNTYYPPNQPTPRRCYALGQALRKAIESWDGDKRVAVIASGGLAHVIMDEELDRVVIDALRKKDREGLYRLPREKLRGGTSEILNWVALAGCAEPMELKYLEYSPGYRSPAATGCGMGFAYWI